MNAARMHIGLLSLLLLVTSRHLAQPVLSGDDFHVFSLFTAEDGLPGRTPNVMAEDDMGFLWVGGDAGLSRYDGNRFLRFKKREDDVHSLPDNRVRALLADGRRLWVGTAAGLCVLDLMTERFAFVPFDSANLKQDALAGPDRRINALHRDPQGRIWVGTPSHGIGLYQPESGTIRFFRLDRADIPADHDLPARVDAVLDFEDDLHDPEVLWAGLYGGLQRLDKRTGTSRYYYFPAGNKEQRIARNAFRRILMHADGRLYAGSWGAVWQVFDPGTGILTPLSVDPRNAPGHPMANIRRLTPDHAGNIWITAGNGLYVYDPGLDQLDEVRRNDGVGGKFYGIDYLDNLQRAYVFRDDGLAVFEPREQVFQPLGFGQLGKTGTALAFSATLTDDGKECLVGVSNGQGVYVLDPKANTWRIDPIPTALRDNAPSVTISSITRLDEHRYIVCLNSALLIYDAGDRSYRPFPADLKVDRSRFYNAFCDSRGNVWIATIQEGVRRWDSRSGVVTSFNVSADPEFGAGNGGTFFEDRRGRMWIKCRYAVAWVDPGTDELHHRPMKGFTAPFNATYCEDPDGRIWVASLDGWIGRLADSDSPDPDLVVQLGSPDNGVLAAVMDPEGTLWCMFRDKLVAYDTRSGHAIPYPFSREIRQHSLFDMTLLPDRRWLILSRDLVFFMDPAAARRTSPLPRPYVNGIDIRGAALLTDTVAHALDVLRLKPFENFFSIHFSAVGLRMDQGQVFRYRLRNFQDNWITAEDVRMAGFTNVPSGTYFFELQVVDDFAGRTGEALVLPVHIGRRWIDRFWVRALLAGLALAMMQAVYRYRIQQIRKEEKMKADHQEALAHAETDALRAQMNPHFIFNSLNSIEGFILRNEPERAANYLNDFARLIRLILENAREKTIPLRREIETLRLYLDMEAMRFSGKFTWSVACDPTLNPDDIRISPMLIQPFVENAVWHGLMLKAGSGNVEVRILPAGDDMVRVVIEDDGIGRARSDEINARKNLGGHRSLGMAITRDRLGKLMTRTGRNARMVVHDLHDAVGNPSGTRVELWVPLERSNPE